MTYREIDLMIEAISRRNHNKSVIQIASIRAAISAKEIPLKFLDSSVKMKKEKPKALDNKKQQLADKVLMSALNRVRSERGDK